MSTTAATGAAQQRDATVDARHGGSDAPRYSWRETVLVLAGYAVLSVLLLGLPVLGHFGTHVIASDDVDSSQFMWFFAWWPHAIFHGLNPFVTHVMFVPQGFNLSWSTSMPGPALLLTPITEAFGPAATWNVIELAAPALTAWTTFLLCRHITRRRVPSLIGGYIFGFSPFVLKHLTGGPYLALAFMVPLLALLVLKRLEGTTSPRRFVAATTAALTAQYLISSEVLLTATVFGGVALVLAFAIYPERRRELFEVIKLLVLAYALTVILISPFLYFFFFGHHYPPGATYFPADLTSYVLPPPLVVALTRHHPPIGGTNDESYLGLPLIVLICLFAWQQRRARATWVILGTALIAGVLSLGTTLWVRGHLTSITLPWQLLVHLPVLRYSIPLRFAEFVVLAAAVVTAMWLSRAPTHGRGRPLSWGLAALAVLFIVPDVGSSVWNTSVKDPPFFAREVYRSYLKPNDHVLTIPVWGRNERWQANTGFRFKLAAGYLGNPFPPSYTRYPIWSTLVSGTLIPNYVVELRRFIHDKGVTTIVVDETAKGPWRSLFASLGVQPVATGGVLFYRLGPAPVGHS